MLYSFKRTIDDIERSEKQSTNGKGKLSIELRVIHNNLYEDLDYYAKSVIDIVDSLNKIEYKNLKQKMYLDEAAAKLQVLFKEIEKTMED
tara:strand:+ start:6604 stop:6873 length:270 start_codon:yes stop_codon:yes gene_type:complete